MDDSIASAVERVERLLLRIHHRVLEVAARLDDLERRVLRLEYMLSDCLGRLDKRIESLRVQRGRMLWEKVRSVLGIWVRRR